MIEFLMDVFGESSQREAIIWKDQAYPYGWLRERVLYWQDQIRDREKEIPYHECIRTVKPREITTVINKVTVTVIEIPELNAGCKFQNFIQLADRLGSNRSAL